MIEIWKPSVKCLFVSQYIQQAVFHNDNQFTVYDTEQISKVVNSGKIPISVCYHHLQLLLHYINAMMTQIGQACLQQTNPHKWKRFPKVFWKFKAAEIWLDQLIWVMQTFSAVQISFANKISSRLEYIKPIDVKQQGYSLLPHNPLPQHNFDMITFNMILTTAPSHQGVRMRISNSLITLLWL